MERRPPRDEDAIDRASGVEFEPGYGAAGDEPGFDDAGVDGDFDARTDRGEVMSAVPRPGRHLIRALLAVGLIVVLFLIPDLSPRPAQAGLSAYRGEILEIAPARTPAAQGFEPNVRVRLTEGPQAGQIVDAYLEGPGGSLDITGWRVGDDVVVTFSRTPEGQEYIAVSDRWRLPQLAGLAALFAATVVLIGGWRGLRALIALGLTIAVVMRLLLPLLIEGVSPIPLAVAAATGVTIATIVLTEGWSRSSVAAILGTATALALTGLLGAFVTQLGGFTGAAESDLVFLQTRAGGGLDLRGILLAAFILGSIGVLDDVTVTQAAFIDEVGERAGLRGRELFASALDIGRSHIAATINTLFLAYVGATLPLLVVLVVSQQPAALVINGETIAIEIVRTLVGSIGIVAAVPITSAIATLLVDASARRPGGGGPRLRLTDPVPALVGGLLLVGASTGVVAAMLGPLGPAPSGATAPTGSAGPSPGASPVAGTTGPSPTGPRATASAAASGQGRSPAPSDDIVPLAVEGEPVDVLDAEGPLGRVTLLGWETGTSGGVTVLLGHVSYQAERAWSVGPFNWTLLGGSGAETFAVEGTRQPALGGRDLAPGEAYDGWFEAPLPADQADLFLVFRRADGTAIFAIPLQ